ncbi:MAG: penicillin-binding protein 1C [Candidatus Eremiobacteraeota bacterium]|nr:penicillin-binding protein 1C [Candidatus Eremiobacteraeota bacterium]
MRRIPAWLVIATAALAVTFAMRAAAIPEPLGSFSPSLTFTDRSGAPLGTTLSRDESYRNAIPIERVSPHAIRAILAAEDARFFEHGPVDAFAFARAGYQAATCLCIVSGGSTITMQLARSQFRLPSTMHGKLLQVLYAARIEASSSKRSVLQAYLNQAAMCENIYGIGAAAHNYFGVSASDLDLAQAAFLAGLPNDPSGLDPRAHWQAAKARQRYVLHRMADLGLIDEGNAGAAMSEPLHLRPRERGPENAAHLLFRLRAENPEIAGTVKTTIDLDLQRFVQAQARDVVTSLGGHNVTQAAAIVIDNRTGDVLAYVGSTDYYDGAYMGSNDGVTALRQPGSTLKPFLYEYAFERHVITPASVLADVPQSYAIPAGRLYSPEDYDAKFAGPVIPRIALAESLNVPAVNVLSRVGVDTFLVRLRELGMRDLERAPAYYGLGLTLGAGEVRLADLAHAYFVMARGGSDIPLRYRVDEPVAQPIQIGDRNTWLRVTDILADSYARSGVFGQHSTLDLPFAAAVKTGTSSGPRDIWTVGFTRDYTVGVWAGNFSGAPMSRVAGVSGAGPLWNRIMLHLHERRDPQPFDLPKGTQRVAICATSGSRIVRACSNVVQELLAPEDEDAQPPVLTNSPVFDAWRAANGQTHETALRILFPRNGAVFEDRLDSRDSRRDEQQLAFVAGHRPDAIVRWSLNGRQLQQSGERAYWTLEPGMWTLRAFDGEQSSVVRFYVRRAQPHGTPGFIVVSR